MLTRLGFPAVGPHRRFVVAIAVDAVGSGVFLPVSILYFLHTTSLSLTEIGLALSVASAVQLPLGPLLGGLVDRIGPKRVLLAANLLEAVGFIGYVFAGSFASVLVAAMFVQLGQTAFWGSFSPVVATVAAPGERERWFGFLGALRNASFALGGLSAALVITIGTTTAYTAVVLANATSYILAFSLILGVKSPPETETEAVAVSTSGSPGWGQVLRDRAYLLLVATNYTYAMSAMALNIVIPVYLTRSLGLPGWLAGAVFTINTLMIGLGQGLVVNGMEGRVRANIIALGCVLSAASYGVLLVAGWTSVPVGVLIALAGAIVYTGGELVAGPVLSALSTDAAPPHLRGRYVSLYQMSWTVSSAISPLALTWLLQEGSVAVWASLTVVALAGVLLSRLLKRVMPQAATKVPKTRPLSVESAPVGPATAPAP